MNTTRARFLVAGVLLSALTGPALAQRGSDNPTFFLVNNSGSTINEAYVSSSRQDNWGEDRLQSNVLPDGLALRIAPPRGQCNNDIRVVYENGRSEEKRNVNTCTGFEVTFGRSGNSGGGSGNSAGNTGTGRNGNPSFNLVNNTRTKITVVRASPNSADDWGDDRLNSRAGIEPGKTAAIRLPEGPCDYDVRVEYEGGRVEERRNVDLCNAVNVSFP